jgi:excisionase family DNA binding protein
MATNEGQWLTPKQLASRLQVSLRTVRRMVREGRIEFTQMRPRGQIRIPYPLKKMPGGDRW